MNLKKGFTIVEMIAVISILGILTAIGLNTFSAVQRKGRDARRKADLELIRAALEQYRSTNSQYPPSIPYPAATTGICDPGGCNVGKYLEVLPKDPVPLQQQYWYQRNGANVNDYDLCALVTGGTSPPMGDCNSTAATTQCNYCLGPYGQE